MLAVHQSVDRSGDTLSVMPFLNSAIKGIFEVREYVY
jgi:hypothetical protein